MCVNYFFYGETLADYFGALVQREEPLQFLARYHRFISFALYLAGERRPERRSASTRPRGVGDACVEASVDCKTQNVSRSHGHFKLLLQGVKYEKERTLAYTVTLVINDLFYFLINNCIVLTARWAV